MKLARTYWLFALAMSALMLSMPASAGNVEVYPPNPSSADSVTLLITDGAPTNGCNLAVEQLQIVRNGRSISVDYAYRSIDPSELPPGTVCFSAHFPAYLWAPIGHLSAGQYEVAVTGSLDGEPRPPRQGAFTVLGDPVGESAAYIPADARWALSLMLLALGGVATWRLRAG